MSAMTWTIILVVGMAAAGVAVAAIVSTIFQGGRSGLIGLGVLFGLAGGAGGWWLDQHSLQPGLAFQAKAKAADASPDVVALKRYYPDEYAAMQRSLAAAKDDHTGAAGALYLIRLQVRSVITRQFPLGADKQLVALMTLQRDEAKALAAKNPAYCTEYFNGGRLSFDPGEVLPADLLQRDAAVAGDLLQQTAMAPAKNAAGAEQRDLSYASRFKLYEQNTVRDAVIGKAQSQFSTDDQKSINLMVRRKASLRDQPALAALMCKYKTALLEENLKLPEPQAAMVYRMNQGFFF